MERAHLDPWGMTPAALTRWLLREGYAVERDGLLVPTERIADLGWAGALVAVIDFKGRRLARGGGDLLAKQTVVKSYNNVRH